MFASQGDWAFILAQEIKKGAIIRFKTRMYQRNASPPHLPFPLTKIKGPWLGNNILKKVLYVAQLLAIDVFFKGGDSELYNHDSRLQFALRLTKVNAMTGLGA